MFYIDRDGVRLHCATLGEGPTLVLCHGLVFGSMASWYFSVAAKLAQRYRVVLFDKRGHGKSDMPASGYDLMTLVDDLAAVIEHTVPRGEPITLMGHSYGALVALHYALRQNYSLKQNCSPQQRRSIRDLILVDAPLPASHYVFPSLAGITSKEILYAQLPTLLSAELPAPSRRNNRMRERLEFLLLHSSLRADVAAAHDIADTELRRLATHTLCVYGRHSDCAAAGKRLGAKLPYAQLEWVDCGHYIMQEAPDELLRVFDAYIAKRERSFVERRKVERRKVAMNGSDFIERKVMRREGGSGY